MMSRAFTPKIVTANHLLEGDVIYQTTDGWTRELSKAEILEDVAHADLRLLEAIQQRHEVVGAYLVDIAPSTTGPKPTHFREEFRKRGPSNYNHGKQAEH